MAVFKQVSVSRLLKCFSVAAGPADAAGAVLIQVSVVIQSSPFRHSVAPCELLFAALKDRELNADHEPTGKTSFPTVVKLIVRRLKAIPRSTRCLFWHHCLANVFRYLTFERL